MKPRMATLVGMIAMAAVARLAPHPWNVTPVAAMALFSGVQFRNKETAFGVPLAAMFLSDLVLGLHTLLPLVYTCFAVTVLMGFWVKKDFSTGRIIAASLASSVLFFILTNFGMWVVGTMYPHTGSGLLQCYVGGLPYFRNTLLGDMGYNALLFGGFYMVSQAFPQLQEVNAA